MDTLAHYIDELTKELEERLLEVTEAQLTINPTNEHMPVLYARAQAERQLLNELIPRLSELAEDLINQPATKE